MNERLATESVTSNRTIATVETVARDPAASPENLFRQLEVAPGPIREARSVHVSIQEPTAFAYIVTPGKEKRREKERKKNKHMDRKPEKRRC